MLPDWIRTRLPNMSEEYQYMYVFVDEVGFVGLHGTQFSSASVEFPCATDHERIILPRTSDTPWLETQALPLAPPESSCLLRAAKEQSQGRISSLLLTKGGQS
jgi:hypothetical protein